MAEQPYSTTMSKLGLGALTFTSALAIYNSWGDAASVLFVLAADAALVVLCLCNFEKAKRGCAGRGTDSKIKAAMWALTTAMFATRGGTLMPLAVGAIVFLCLRDVDHVIRTGDGGARVADMDAQYSALVKMGFAVVTCNSALDAYDTRSDDPGSAALVLVSYAALLILTGLFVRAVARAHTGDGDHGQG